ncbi:MAG TPA: 4'-phosphopantetheinyl transferase superfamily protein [Terracidiphilus sp.]|nr:4'-phosphopantetheinyl transferase superfamily protein [Terracidiphilus sp.]
MMPTDPAPMNGNESVLHLWCAYPDDLLEEAAARNCEALLDAEERARWQRFQHEQRRREFLTTHALARTALSQYRGVAPQDWRFSTNAHGKPALEPDCGLRFNLSNSLGLAVCLVADAPVEVGVDVEPFTRAGQIADVAHKVFSPAERAQLGTLSAEEKLDRCVSLWTLKEAYIKARGTGLGSALPLCEISFLFDDSGAVRLEVGPALDEDAARWWFRTLDHAGHRIAAVAEGPAKWEFEVLEVRPATAAPKRVL